MVKTSVTHSAAPRCATFLFLPHFDVICDLLGTLSTDDGNGDGDGRGYWENPNYQTRMSGAKMPSGSRHVAT